MTLVSYFAILVENVLAMNIQWVGNEAVGKILMPLFYR